MQPAEQIEKAIGKNFAQGATKAKPKLEKLAQDIDIFVSAEKDPKGIFNALKIKVAKSKDTPADTYVKGLDTPIAHEVFNSKGIYASDIIAQNVVKTAQRLKRFFVKNPTEIVESEPKNLISKTIGMASPKEMINPEAYLGSHYAQFYRYVSEHRKGNIQDLKDALDLSDNFIEGRIRLGDIYELIHLHKNSPRQYVAAPGLLRSVRMYRTIKPEYYEQFEKEIKGLFERNYLTSNSKL